MKITINQHGGNIMSMISIICGIIIVVLLAVTYLRKPDYKHKTLLSVLLILTVIFIILNILW